MLQILIQFLVAPISAGVGLDLGIRVFQLDWPSHIFLHVKNTE